MRGRIRRTTASPMRQSPAITSHRLAPLRWMAKDSFSRKRIPMACKGSSISRQSWLPMTA